MKIEVRPIEMKRWHGHQGKSSFARPKTLNVLVDGETRQYATGLDYVNKTFTDPEDPKKKITEAEYYSKLMKVDLSPQSLEDVLHPFWDSKNPKIKLENRTMFFDTEIPIEYIKIKVMKASKFVANSMKEWEEGYYPYATHVITDEAEEVETKASKVQAKNQAIILLDSTPTDRKIQLVLVLGGKNLRGASDNAITVEIDKLIGDNPQEVLRHLKMDKEEISLNALVLEALMKNVLKKQGHKIMYYDSSIGNDIHEVVHYLQLDENQDLKLRIMSEVTK